MTQQIIRTCLVQYLFYRSSAVIANMTFWSNLINLLHTLKVLLCDVIFFQKIIYIEIVSFLFIRYINSFFFLKIISSMYNYINFKTDVEMLHQCMYRLLLTLFEKYQPNLVNQFNIEYLKLTGMNSNDQRIDKTGYKYIMNEILFNHS